MRIPIKFAFLFVVHCLSAPSKPMEVLVNVKPAQFWGITPDGNSFVDMKLMAGGVGTMAYGAFSFDSEKIALYQFYWSPNRTDLRIKNLKRISEFGEDVRINVDWHGTSMNLTVVAKTWKREVQLIDASRLKKVGARADLAIEGLNKKTRERKN